MSLALLALIVFAAYTVHTALGFGCHILAVTLGAQLFPLDLLLPVLVALNIPVTVYIAVRHRKNIDTATLWRRFLPFMVLGMPFGLALFLFAPGNLLKMAFGAFVVVLSVLELVRLKKGPDASPVSPLSFPVGAATLLVAGVMQGLYATGGPMAVYFAGRQYRDDRSTFRATLSLLWLITDAVLLAGYGFDGKITWQAAEMTGLLLVPLLVGVFAGEWLHGRLNERTSTLVVYLLLTAAGLLLVVRS